MKLTLTVMAAELAVSRLDESSEIPNWAAASEFFSITRTEDELSIVSSKEDVPVGIKSEAGWRALKVEGPLDFSMVGVLASMASPLAQKGISIFVISTYDTDYILVKKEDLREAIRVLSKENIIKN
ncbi:hypothetical protein SAMN06265827_111124 [Orenia metallireducens]|jgi:hypothetical protein|uniref:Uncharacterized protein n=1 Tax=Orenia metallireducens TaxID=1413210 RepID=A0A285GWW3_9FIRM|nr:ACT domain-containing protein [Orenia metallireducens]SNY28002.1 hypothetical protein SAMN06265827_111124 [Orenia metallireducens]